MGIIVQVLGSLLILIGFVFSQLGKLKTTSLLITKCHWCSNFRNRCIYWKTMGIYFIGQQL